jgi:hypothetical protein
MAPSTAIAATLSKTMFRTWRLLRGGRRGGIPGGIPGGAQ